MASYYQIGSQGDEVKRLQQALTDAGYSVGSAGVDGIFGNDTAAAVRAYQKANSLTVDGIAGTQTLGSLYTTKPVTPTTTPAPVAQQQPIQPIQQTQPIQPIMQTEYENPFAQQEQTALANYQQWASQPYVSQYAPQIEALVKSVLARQFQYDPKNDGQFQLASKELTRNVLEAMNSRGILNSTVTENQVQQGVANLLPQYQQLAYNRFQDEGEMLMSQVDMLTGLDNTAYGRYQDQGKQLASAFNMVMQMSDGQYQKWQDAYERRYRTQQDQIKQAEAKAEAERLKVKDAWDRVSELGYVDNTSSIILGVPAGTLSREAREAKEDREFRLQEMRQSLNNQLATINAQYEKEKKVASLRDSGTADPSTLGTQPQVDNYYQLRDIYFGGGSGTYANDPLKAYNWLISHSKDNIALIGDNLYNKLLTELTTAMKVNNSYGKVNTSTTSTVDDYASTINKMYVTYNGNGEPTTVNYQGIADYLNSLVEKGVDQRIVDDLAGRYGLGISE